MQDAIAMLSRLRRPRLLIRAARVGASDYDRVRDLARIRGLNGRLSPRAALGQLLRLEAEHEERRRAGLATYSVSAHVTVLTALLAEARLVIGSAAPTRRAAA